jgi:hypothetical protein
MYLYSFQIKGDSPKKNLSGLESLEYGRRDSSRWPRGTLYPQKLALTSPTSDYRSVGVVRSRPQAMEFFLVWIADIRGLVTRSGIPLRRVVQLWLGIISSSEAGLAILNFQREEGINC